MTNQNIVESYNYDEFVPETPDGITVFHPSVIHPSFILGMDEKILSKRFFLRQKWYD